MTSALATSTSPPAALKPRLPTVAVFGASGTTGVELAHLLRQHPGCLLTDATSRSHAGRPLRDIDPAAPDLELVHPDSVVLDDIDVAFVCLPHGHAAALAERCFRAGVRTVDLSGDLRLRDESVHAQVYGTPRSQAVAAKATYGLVEVARDALAEARLVSNPGCYPTCSALALLPLAKRQLLPPTVVIDAMSGISGAGRQATATTHFCAVVDDVRPYKSGRSHRHTAEIEQLLSSFGQPIRVVFNPHVVPLERGMLATTTIEVEALTATEVHELYVETYAAEPLVDVLPLDTPARIRGVCRTSRAAIGIHRAVGTRYVVLTCAIDNLRKGAASQAIQNMNIMLGYSETLGLAAPHAGAAQA